MTDISSIVRTESAYIELKDCREGQPASLPTSQTRSVLSGLSAKQSAAAAAAKIFKVQFNPAALSFSAGARTEPEEKKSLTRGEDGQVAECNVTDEYKPLILSFQLVFDRSNSLTDSSVQPEVEGFLAIIKNPYIRQVAFHWGSMYYSGKITGMKVNYTMFGLTGIPMRATVDMTMEVY